MFTKKFLLAGNISIISFFLISKAYCAVDQILNDNFFQNPAELNIVNKAQVIAGNVLINPVFRFEGVSYGMSGSAGSNVTNALPYLLSSYRFTDKFVMGINITPSGYGHLDWPIDSIVAQDTTQTELFYYRFGIQSSYQFTENLALGIGFNFADNAHFQLNFLIPGQGNQINSVSGLNYVGDLGLYYKINAKNYLTVAGYTQVNTYGHGTSSTGTTVVNNLSLNITAAPVIYLGIEHFADNGWFLEGKIYWSGWSIQKNIDFTNTTTGTYVVPTNWKDVWSFQVTTRYTATDKLALLGSIIYETNPVPLATNAIGYPLAASGSLSAGLDVTIQKELSAQIIYSYGAFLPNSPIDNTNSVGMITAHFQAAVLQLIYKV
ncbi:MAG: outer membrane protein transport protein [Gammaproteobacteria bacterium]|nr:outer membrane protein transport protein [Gammaproteobacteria bacterium]